MRPPADATRAGQVGGFEGIVLATEPTAQLGKLLMDELISFTTGSGGIGASSCPYTKQQADRCMGSLTRLSYGQTRDIGGGWTATPHPSGHCLGGSNWVIASPTHRVAVIGASSMSPHVRHPMPLNFQALEQCDLAIIGDLIPRERDAGGSEGPAYPLNDVCTGISQTVLRGGNVLLPVSPCGSAIDLIHAVGIHLPGAGLAHTNIYLVSPVGQGVIGYLEILAEWVHTSRRDRVYIPESPFLHNDMIASNRLHIVPEVWALSSHNYTEPCVVLAGHPSLRFGPVVHFLRLWASNVEDAVILTDPAWNSVRGDLGASLLKPHQPLQMKKMCVAIDLRLTQHQAAQLITQLAPVSAVLPGQRLAKGDAAASLGGALTTVTVASPAQATPAMMDVDLACSLTLKQAGGIPATAVSCRLRERDGALTLERLPGEGSGGGAGGGEHRSVYGQVMAPSLVNALTRRGIEDCEVIYEGGKGARGGACTVRSVSAGAEVVIGNGTCLIVTGMGEEKGGEEGGMARLARVVTEAVMEQLTML